MFAFSDDAFSRSFDLFDLGEAHQDGEKVIFEAVGADIEYDIIDYEFCDASSIISSQCSSCGTPSCSSSPCSSERDYTIESPSLHENLFDIDGENMDFGSMNFHHCLSPVKRSKHQKHEESRNSLQRRHKHSSRKQRRKNELDVVLTCSECRWSELSTQKQQEVLESLIGMVSQKLGLREQLQLIRIISPDADVSPNDKEFFIDFDLFDDEKFQGVCNFIKHHLFVTKDMRKGISSTEKYSRRSAKRKMEATASPELWENKDKSQEKKVLAKASKQLKKEKRSGLFEKEQVLLIKENVPSIPEEEELDVVT